MQAELEGARNALAAMAAEKAAMAAALAAKDKLIGDLMAKVNRGPRTPQRVGTEVIRTKMRVVLGTLHESLCSFYSWDTA